MSDTPPSQSTTVGPINTNLGDLNITDNNDSTFCCGSILSAPPSPTSSIDSDITERAQSIFTNDESETSSLADSVLLVRPVTPPFIPAPTSRDPLRLASLYSEWVDAVSNVTFEGARAFAMRTVSEGDEQIISHFNSEGEGHDTLRKVITDDAYKFIFPSGLQQEAAEADPFEDFLWQGRLVTGLRIHGSDVRVRTSSTPWSGRQTSCLVTLKGYFEHHAENEDLYTFPVFHWNVNCYVTPESAQEVRMYEHDVRIPWGPRHANWKSQTALEVWEEETKNPDGKGWWKIRGLTG
nr:uncharacterized protein CI109_007106 [Kwoniella shandongensis]KAA5524559.1 hypothetical protein CI109_007106 [Kwoniella shandongensis]